MGKCVGYKIDKNLEDYEINKIRSKLLENSLVELVTYNLIEKIGSGNNDFGIVGSQTIPYVGVAVNHNSTTISICDIKVGKEQDVDNMMNDLGFTKLA